MGAHIIYQLIVYTKCCWWVIIDNQNTNQQENLMGVQTIYYVIGGTN